ncbi:MAG: hypothetical protein LBE82_08940 [Chitinophagaceae bacterium]|jgi:hypothetical protein|nr:hypothetical protein [Chitinophagaceae bacterium]
MKFYKKTLLNSTILGRCKFAIIIVIIALMVGCGKNAAQNIPNYPYNIGSKWVYLVYDSVLQYSDTETVEITGTTQINNGINAKVFKHSFSSNKDSVAYSYLTENVDTLLFWTEISGYYSYYQIYVFPINVGRQWMGVNTLDTNRVVSYENTIVPAGNFNAYKITGNYYVTNYFFSENEWYSPSIGMIKRDYYTRNFAFPEWKSYQLLSYELN